MADIPRLVDDVRAFLLSSDKTMTPRLGELAKQYADACTDANKRLARCQRLLQQGLRVEALHLAREAPDLLDTVQALSFPELPAWLAEIQIYDLASPPSLDANAIEFIQSAYVEDDPLKELLRQHRRAALARAPLKGRLETLRKLAAGDPENLIWPADIQVFETARIEQLHVESEKARRDKDIPSLRSLYDELAAKTWTVPVPRPLLHGVKLSLETLNNNQVVANLSQLINRFHDAFDALDEDECRDLRKLWRQLEKDSGRPADAGLFDQVRPIFQWLEQKDLEDQREQDFFKARTDLIEEIEEGHSLSELYAKCDALLEFDSAIPDDLATRLDTRIAELQNWRKWVRVMAISTAALAILSVSLIGWWWAKKSADRVAAETAAEKIDTLVKSGHLDDAEKAIAEIARDSPAIDASEVVAGARSRYKKAVSAEQARAVAFGEMYQQAEKVDLEKVEDGALKAVQDAAKTGPERQRVKDLLASRESQRSQAAKKRVDEVSKKLDRFVERVQKLKPLVREDSPNAEQAIDRLRGDLDEIASEAREAGQASLRRHTSVVESLRELRDDLDSRAKIREAESLFANAGRSLPESPISYIKGLESTVKALNATKANSPRATQLNRVIEEAPAWQAAIAWARIAATWKSTNDNPERAAVAKPRSEECVSFLKAHPASPDRELIERMRAYYKAITSRTEGGDESLRNRLLTRLSLTWMDRVYVTRVTRGGGRTESYYSKAPYNKDNRTVKAFRSYKVEDVKLQPFTPSEQVEDGMSPHSKLADELKAEIIADTVMEDWDRLMISLGRKVAGDARSDGLLRLGLLRDLVKIAGEGSTPLAFAFTPVVGRVDTAAIDRTLRWMDPSSEDANARRPDAEKLIASAFGWTEVELRLKDARLAFAKEIDAIPQPVGRLVHQKDWTCAPIGLTSRTSPVKEGELRVAVMVKGKGAWKKVGRMVDGVPRIEGADAGALIEGRVVFVSAKAS